MTADSHSLHALMTGVIQHRKTVPVSPPPMSSLISALGDLQQGFELGVGLEACRERALALACLAFRIAVELQSPVVAVPAQLQLTA